MIKDLNTKEIGIIAYLTMHHGMLRCKKDSEEYKAYRKISEKLLDEVTEREKGSRLSVNLFHEFMEDSLSRICEIEYIPQKIKKMMEKKKINQEQSIKNDSKKIRKF